MMKGSYTGIRRREVSGEGVDRRVVEEEKVEEGQYSWTGNHALRRGGRDYFMN